MWFGPLVTLRPPHWPSDWPWQMLWEISIRDPFIQLLRITDPLQANTSYTFSLTHISSLSVITADQYSMSTAWKLGLWPRLPSQIAAINLACLISPAVFLLFMKTKILIKGIPAAEKMTRQALPWINSVLKLQPMSHQFTLQWLEVTTKFQVRGVLAVYSLIWLRLVTSRTRLTQATVKQSVSHSDCQVLTHSTRNLVDTKKLMHKELDSLPIWPLIRSMTSSKS